MGTYDPLNAFRRLVLEVETQTRYSDEVLFSSANNDVLTLVRQFRRITMARNHLIAALLFAASVPHFVHATELQQGLVAYWPLDDGSGATAADSFGNDLDIGQLINEPEWLGDNEARLGSSALRFDGIEQSVLVPQSTDLDIGTNAVSLSAWVNLDTAPSLLAEAFGGIYDSAGDNYVLYLDRSAQELRFKVTDVDGDAERPGVPESQLALDTWHHVMGVYDGNEGVAKLYFNGELVDSHANPNLTGLVLPGQIANIGANTTVDPDVPTSRFFPGGIDDVAVWNRPLGRAEASYLYNSGMGTAVGAANPDITPIPDAPGVTPVAPTAQPVVHLAFENNLLNSGTGGSAYDGELLDFSDGNVNLYTDGSVGLALDLRENAVSDPIDGDGVAIDYEMTDNGTVLFDYTPSEYYNFQSLFTNSADPNDWEMWIYNDGRLRGRVDGNSFGEFNLENLSGVGETYQIAFTWERDTEDAGSVAVKLYVDGEQRDQDLEGNWVDPGETVYIAGGDDTNHFGNGIWDEFRIYDQALTAGEVLYLFTGGETTCDPDSGGDLDQNGKVEFADFLILSGNFGNEVASHEEGDIDCNGTVEFADFLVLSGNFGKELNAAGGAQVPEPSGFSLISSAALLLIWRRRR